MLPKNVIDIADNELLPQFLGIANMQRLGRDAIESDSQINRAALCALTT